MVHLTKTTEDMRFSETLTMPHDSIISIEESSDRINSSRITSLAFPTDHASSFSPTEISLLAVERPSASSAKKSHASSR